QQFKQASEKWTALNYAYPAATRIWDMSLSNLQGLETLGSSGINDWNTLLNDFNNVAVTAIAPSSNLALARNIIVQQADSISNKTINFWGMTFDIPQRLLALAFPIVFLLSGLVLRALKIDRKIALMKLAFVESIIAEQLPMEKNLFSTNA